MLPSMREKYRTRKQSETTVSMNALRMKPEELALCFKLDADYNSATKTLLFMLLIAATSVSGIARGWRYRSLFTSLEQMRFDYLKA